MKNIINKLKYNYSLFILFFLLAFEHAFFKLSNDDFVIIDIVSSGSLVDKLIERYNYGEGSWFCQTILFIFAKYYNLFFIMNILMCILIVFYLRKLILNNSNTIETNFFIICLFLLWPMGTVSSAGWMTTSIVYLWIIPAALYTFYITKKIINNEKIKTYEYLVSIITLLYASNREQSGLLILTILIPLALYNRIILSNKNSFIFFQVFIAIINFGSVLLSPGMKAKSIRTISKKMPYFDMMSMIEKFHDAFSDTMNYFIIETHVIVVLFTIIITVLIYAKYNELLFRIIGTYPIAYVVFTKINPWKQLDFLFAKSEMINIENALSISKYFPNIMQMLWLGCIITSLWLILENTHEFLLLLIVLMAGMGTRIAMGFTGSLHASGSRTTIFLYFAIMYVSSYLFNKEGKLINNKTFITLLCGLTLFNLVNFVLTIRYYSGSIPFYMTIY